MNEHQFGFMKGRYIRDNIRSPLSVKNLAEDEISLVFYYPLTLKKLLMPSVGNSLMSSGLLFAMPIISAHRRNK
jgi:hypothetical protein